VETTLAHERVLRPLNIGAEAPGRGVITLPVAGEDVRVLVLADRLAMEDSPPDARVALGAYQAWAALPPGPTTIVEMHALSVMASQGLDPQAVVARVRGLPPEQLPPVRPADGEIVLAAILLEIEDGLTRALRRL
jgi:calcineurin-like phosphoesterase